MTVAVTGASGYLGRHLVGLLDDPIIVPRDDSPIAADVVIHAAAAVPKALAQYRDADMAEATIQMTTSLLRRLTSCRRLVLVSSQTAAYPPAHAYGWGKLVSEWAARGARSDGVADELVIVRLPGLFGEPRQSGAIYEAIRLTGRSGIPDWPVMHVADAAGVVARAVTQPFDHVSVELTPSYPPGLLRTRLDDYAAWVVGYDAQRDSATMDP